MAPASEDSSETDKTEDKDNSKSDEKDNDKSEKNFLVTPKNLTLGNPSELDCSRTNGFFD